MRRPLRVAAVQPACTAKDVVGNARVHAVAVLAARARVVVSPELSLTGYELDADPIAPEGSALEAIVNACAATGSLALIADPTGVSAATGWQLLDLEAHT